MSEEIRIDIPQELLEAARELGEVLRERPEVQAYLLADAAARSDPELTALEAEVNRLYQDLSGRQRSGGTLTQAEINRFYSLRERLTLHPLVLAREKCEQDARAVLEQAGASISAILTVNYSGLVLED